ncbi:hypothetical protein [Coxiella endosymbiont of Ornithodoros amblus]|uniref:hypothetical protein n=1 Tax=Coxiella endosymbiont of Ornithodoros amblus TaxID=1656166 RepID=UPI003CC794B2
MTGFQASETAVLATMGIGCGVGDYHHYSLPLIDSLGRCPLLFIVISAMMISLLVLSWSFKVHGHMDYPIDCLWKLISIYSGIFN